MASILDKYGIKEVADVTFYELGDTGLPTNPVLYLDTLKVSTLEQTGEAYDARGGKGNAILLSWDSNKEINVTLEDALFSAKSMAIMFGNGTTKEYNNFIMKTEEFTATGTELPVAGANASGWKYQYEGPDGKLYYKFNPKFYDAKGEKVAALVAGQKYFCSYDVVASGSVIDVSANSFPGTYYVTGDTFARSNESGNDEFFQFILPKAKVTSENTITLEADGDPSVFNMNLKVLRPSDGVMMKLVKYNLEGGVDAGADVDAGIVHNHVLKTSEDVDNLGVIVTAGKTASIVAPAGTTGVTSAAAAVATAAFSGSTITVTGVAAGDTTVAIAGANRTIEVHVNAAG